MDLCFSWDSEDKMGEFDGGSHFILIVLMFKSLRIWKMYY